VYNIFKNRFKTLKEGDKMNGNIELTVREEKLIQELTQIISEIDSQDKALKESVFRGLASYIEGIKVGLTFQKNIHSI